MAGHNEARNLIGQEPGRENRYASDAAATPNLSNQRVQHQLGEASSAVQNRGKRRFSGTEKSAGATHETADGYAQIVAYLCDGWRVIVCKDNIQWILQRRKKGGAERPWRAVGYFRTREALIRLCAASCGRIDPATLAALAALPETIGGAA